MPGSGDRVLLHLAQAEHRVVVTLDTDFGELAFRFGLPADSGVILIRLEWRDPIAFVFARWLLPTTTAPRGSAALPCSRSQ
jgi:hypothetical protein